MQGRAGSLLIRNMLGHHGFRFDLDFDFCTLFQLDLLPVLVGQAVGDANLPV